MWFWCLGGTFFICSQGLSGVISGDGNLSPVKHTDGVYQIYSRFEKLKFISIKLSELIYNPNNFYYPGFVENVFFEALFKYSRISDSKINELFENTLPNAVPQIIVPLL